MWDGLFLLILLCIVMASASFLAGMLPLYFSLSSRQLRLISALGTGVLVGTALIIIIPEGVETLYSASESSHSHDSRSMPLRTRAKVEVFPGSMKHDTWRRDEMEALPIDAELRKHHFASNDLYTVTVLEAEASPNVRRQDNGNDETETHQDPADAQPQQEDDQNDNTPTDDDQASSSHRDPHAYVGVSLIAGFLLMYLIDTLPKQYFTRSRPQRFQISLNNLNFNNNANRSDSLSSIEDNLPNPTTTSNHSHNTSSSSTTTGLVIHACADGIALGASSTTTSRLTFIIFIALIVHKAPAAFGLTSVLLRQGLAKRRARAHLIVFSLAAPLGALLTWFAAHLLGYSTATMSNSMSTEFATGILLLFSGGTFLYVAVHTMQDAEHAGGELGSGDDGGRQVNGYRGVPMSDLYEAGVGTGSAAGQGVKGGGDGGGRGKVGDTLVTCLGMLVPLLINFRHGH